MVAKERRRSSYSSPSALVLRRNSWTETEGGWSACRESFREKTRLVRLFEGWYAVTPTEISKILSHT